jgi:hypothetical protein
MVDLGRYRNEVILLLLFIVVNIVIYSFSYEGAPLDVGADAGQYLRPARSLIDYGEFTMNPLGWTPDMGDSRSFTFGTPLYSILLAIPYYFFGQGEAFYVTIVIIQCSLLYLIGWISRSFLSFFNSKRVILIHVLVIFNPNSLTTAHLIQSETLFTLFVVIALLYIFKYIKYSSKINLVVVGVSVGLLALTRPAGLYLVYMIPVILIVIQILEYYKIEKSKGNGIQYINFIIPILVAFIVMSPWYIRNYVDSGKLFLTSESGYYLKNNYQVLIQRGRMGLTEQEAIKISDDKHLSYIRKNNLNSACLHNIRNPDCDRYVYDAALDGILSEPIASHLRAFFHSFGILYISGGASNFRNYIGLEGNTLVVDFQQEKFKGLDSIISLIRKMDVGYLLIFIVFTGFSVITRFLGLIGLYRTIKTSEAIVYLIPIVGVLVIFTAMYLYLGQSRFRVPLEPILMLLTVLSFSKKDVD